MLGYTPTSQMYCVQAQFHTFKLGIKIIKIDYLLQVLLQVLQRNSLQSEELHS